MSEEVETTSGDLDCFRAELSQSDFKVFSDYIYNEFGIKMPDIKRVMLQGRLLKRIRELKMNSYTEYKEYFFSEEGQKNELYNFLSVVTTNKTDFFREPVHFDFLSKEILPQYVSEGKRKIKIWSAACSTGDEPYSLVMALSRHLPLNQIKIFATDLDKQVIEKAKVGLYKDVVSEGISSFPPTPKALNHS